MWCNKKTVEEIVEYIIGSELLTGTSDDIHTKVTKIIDSISKPSFTKYFNNDVMEKLFDVTTHNKGLQCSHFGYPIPDPVKGRPKISWLECKYSKCNKTFSTDDGLIVHLKQNNKYTPFMHTQHSQVARDMGLTKDMIISKGLTKCPSYICTEATHTFTPETLCEHFRLMGIEPFWTEGMIITEEDMLSNKDHFTGMKVSLNSTTDVITVDKCIVCLDNKPEVVFNPCFHHVLCLGCSQNVASTCPICRRLVASKFPF
jgi:hypothetical protein